MGSSHKGLGIGNSPAGHLAPSPAIIKHFFTEELHYWQNPRYLVNGKKTTKYVDENFCITFCKAISQADNPLFECLKGAHCYSWIKVDMWTGSIVDSWFQFKNVKTVKKSPETLLDFSRSFSGIRSYIDLQIACSEFKLNYLEEEVYNSLAWVFKWHLNLVHMAREYIAGGWLNRPRRKKAQAAIQEKLVILNQVGYTDILNKAKPFFDPDSLRAYEEAMTPPTKEQIAKAEERLALAKQVFKDEQNENG